MDSVFVLQFLQETYKEKHQYLHMVSADRLSIQRFDMEHHVNDRYYRVNVQKHYNSDTGSVVDRPLLNTKWMLPNSTIVLSMWFIIRSNSFSVWDISFILQKLL